MYNIGEKIVYPLHGAGVIEAIEEKEVLGETGSYYIMRLAYDNIRVIFPVSSNAADSVRDVIPEQEADRVIEYFKEFYEEVTNNWNKRYRSNITHIKCGNIFEVAQVVKMLMLREKKFTGGLFLTTLSTAVRYRKVRKFKIRGSSSFLDPSTE